MPQSHRDHGVAAQRHWLLDEELRTRAAAARRGPQCSSLGDDPLRPRRLRPSLSRRGGTSSSSRRTRNCPARLRASSSASSSPSRRARRRARRLDSRHRDLRFSHRPRACRAPYAPGSAGRDARATQRGWVFDRDSEAEADRRARMSRPMTGSFRRFRLRRHRRRSFPRFRRRYRLWRYRRSQPWKCPRFRACRNCRSFPIRSGRRTRTRDPQLGRLTL